MDAGDLLSDLFNDHGNLTTAHPVDEAFSRCCPPFPFTRTMSKSGMTGSDPGYLSKILKYFKA